MSAPFERLTCGYCGLPFRGRRPPPGETPWCCSGCALASRLQIDAGHFPVTPQLVVWLALGFVAFNAVLAALLGWALAREGQAAAATIARAAGAGLGVAVWLGAAGWQAARLRLQGRDLAVMLVLGVLAFAVAKTVVEGRWAAAAGRGALLGWLALGWQWRGFLRRWLARCWRRNSPR